MKKFRFAVGSADGLRSTVWQLWTSGLEFYLQSRMMGGSVKVSIHSGGVGQYSMQSDWYGKHRPNQPNQARHIDRWRWVEPTDQTASLVFRMFVPQTALRDVRETEDLSTVAWLDEPGAGRQLQIVCYVSPAPIDAAPVNEPRFLSALERGAGSIVVFAFPVDVCQEDLRQMDLVNAQVENWAAENGVELKPTYRLAGLAVDATGGRSLIEFAPRCPL